MQPVDGPLIRAIEEADPTWVRAALVGSRRVPPEAELADVRPARLDAGLVGDCYRLTLRWADHSPVGLPSSVVVKLAAPAHRDAAWAAEAYSREVQFYRRLGRHTPVRVPACHLAAHGRGGAVLLLEDVAGEAVDQLAGLTLPQVTAALAALARLQAALWHSPAWIAGRADGLRRAVAGYRLSWRGFLDRYGDGLSAPQRRVVADLRHTIAEWIRADAGQRTVLHGDFRAGNLLFGPDGVTVLDWQTVGAGAAASDAAYLIGGSLPAAARRQHEAELFATYADHLRRAGARVDDDALRASYRANAVTGVHLTVVSAMLLDQPADSATGRLFAVLADRHTQHAADLRLP